MKKRKAKDLLFSAINVINVIASAIGILFYKIGDPNITILCATIIILGMLISVLAGEDMLPDHMIVFVLGIIIAPLCGKQTTYDIINFAALALCLETLVISLLFSISGAILFFIAKITGEKL